MVSDMTFTTVAHVMDSWEALRRLPNYEEVVGTMLFEKMFEIDATALKVFSVHGEADLGSPRMVRHAQHYVRMLDRAVALLGPDIELLTEIMLDLGKSHARYGVKPEHYVGMGQALIATIEKVLGDRFQPAQKDAWLEVYQALSYDMIRATTSAANQ